MIRETGCSLPCRYREFKLVGAPKQLDPNAFGFDLSYAKTEIVEEEEILIYGIVSFVSEFGEALGLFLGFSFFSIWDIFYVVIVATYKEKKSPKKW